MGEPILNRVFPSRIDNRYRGNVVALWLFVPIALQRVAMSLTHLLKADGGAQSISTIPLDSYPASAAQNIIALFARLGLEQLVFGSLLVLVLLRYRAMIPLMYLLLVGNFIGSQVVSAARPLVLAGTSGVKLPFLVIGLLCILGFILSVFGKGYAAKAQLPE